MIRQTVNKVLWKMGWGQVIKHSHDYGEEYKDQEESSEAICEHIEKLMRIPDYDYSKETPGQTIARQSRIKNNLTFIRGMEGLESVPGVRPTIKKANGSLKLGNHACKVKDRWTLILPAGNRRVLKVKNWCSTRVEVLTLRHECGTSEKCHDGVVILPDSSEYFDVWLGYDVYARLVKHGLDRCERQDLAPLETLSHLIHQGHEIVMNELY